MTSMFMRVNLKCSHQARPPRGRTQRSAAFGQTSLIRAQDLHWVQPQGAVRRYQAGDQNALGMWARRVCDRAVLLMSERRQRLDARGAARR